MKYDLRLYFIENAAQMRQIPYVSGDGVSNVDLNELVVFHRSHGKIATITTVNLGQSKGVLNIADDNTVLSFREKDDKIVVSEFGIIFHNMPQDRLFTDLDHWLWF